jgi:hypothetical protein
LQHAVTNCVKEGLALAQVTWARLNGRDDRTVRRWALKERAVPPEVSVLVGLLLAKRITVKDIEQARATNRKAP